ncbi:MAG: hypothetical protein JKX85_02145 [Phycisphaeraceae bacterium]|nr:hypothetical protein [Phycisphaeraceae bacterium]
MVKRNALIAAGNHLAQQQDHNLRERIDEIAQDESESEMVRNTAKVVMSRLDER